MSGESCNRDQLCVIDAKTPHSDVVF